MKNILYKTFLILIFNFISLFAQDLEISLTMDKSDFLKYEPIDCIAELKNISNNTILITKALDLEYETTGTDILLFDESGQRVYTQGHLQFSGDVSSGIKLPPGQSLVSFINLTKLGFGDVDNENWIEGPLLRNIYLTTGKYKIQLSYFYFYGKDKKTIYSNQIDFNVIEPNTSDIVVYNEIRNTWKEIFNTPKTDMGNAFNKLINKYPKNQYMASIFKYTLGSQYIKGVNKEELLLKMIENHPSSFKTLISVIGCPQVSDSFRNTASSQLKSKNETNKVMLEKYENYKTKILNQK